MITPLYRLTKKKNKNHKTVNFIQNYIPANQADENTRLQIVLTTGTVLLPTDTKWITVLWKWKSLF